MHVNRNVKCNMRPEYIARRCVEGGKHHFLRQFYASACKEGGVWKILIPHIFRPIPQVFFPFIVGNVSEKGPLSMFYASACRGMKIYNSVDFKFC